MEHKKRIRRPKPDNAVPIPAPALTDPFDSYSCLQLTGLEKPVQEARDIRSAEPPAKAPPPA